MQHFTKSQFVYDGITYYRYEGDRKRGGATWVFYNQVPHNTNYYPTWPNAVKLDATLGGKEFVSRINGDMICMDFINELSISEENALDTLYANHVAPVPIV